MFLTLKNRLQNKLQIKAKVLAIIIRNAIITTLKRNNAKTMESKMKSLNLELLNINDEGVAWLLADTGETFGIASAFEVMDDEGIIIPDVLAVEILEQHCEVNQNFETEANEIEFIAENGESATLSIGAHSVQLIDNK